MRIKMLTTAASPDGVFLAGQVVDVTPKLAKAFVAGGYALAVESAAIEQPEKAVLAQAKPKKVKQNGAEARDSSDDGAGEPAGG
ncbi:hypothetical protein [Marinobacter sp.]|uniref:hypothetical protein n=1 Tax=Marinobacter sp. TaxID=50741 RepID=UPI0019AA52D1|nr:hypothetical protein [Marinobacter sp.]MBC7193871.1 hypothetical protein [Marinobacter sp.]